MSDPMKPSLKLLTTLGSIAVHVEESMSENCHAVDLSAIKSLLQDTDLKKWIKDMGVFMPVKRGTRSHE